MLKKKKKNILFDANMFETTKQKDIRRGLQEHRSAHDVCRSTGRRGRIGVCFRSAAEIVSYWNFPMYKWERDE